MKLFGEWKKGGSRIRACEEKDDDECAAVFRSSQYMANGKITAPGFGPVQTANLARKAADWVRVNIKQCGCTRVSRLVGSRRALKSVVVYYSGQ